MGYTTIIKRTILVLSIIILVTIFVYAETKVDTSNGVDKKEAIIIAKDYMRSEQMDKDYILFWPSVTENYYHENSWHINFPPNIKTFFTVLFDFGVDVDKKSGRIISVEVMK